MSASYASASGSGHGLRLGGPGARDLENQNVCGRPKGRGAMELYTYHIFRACIQVLRVMCGCTKRGHDAKHREPSPCCLNMCNLTRLASSAHQAHQLGRTDKTVLSVLTKRLLNTGLSQAMN